MGNRPTGIVVDEKTELAYRLQDRDQADTDAVAR